MATRCLRRSQKERKRNRIAKVVLNVWRERNPQVLVNMIHNADNPKMCNGPCCKNPRRSGYEKAKGKTIRELRDDIGEQTQVLEVFEDTFICSNCGHVTCEDDRSGNTSECVYC